MKKNRVPFIIIALVLFYFLVVVLMVVSERGSSGSNIKTLGDSFWCSITTLTTVGYGDKFPVTFFGRVLSMFFIIGSIGLIAFFVGSITDFIRKDKEMKKMGHKGTDFSKHIVILGWDDFGRAVVEQLIAANRKVAIITDQLEQIDLIYSYFEKDQCFVYYGEWQNLKSMEGVNAKKAQSIFVNIPDDSQRLIAVLNLKNDLPNASFVVTLDNTALRDTYYSAGVTYVLSRDELASKLLASCIFEPDVAQMTQNLLSAATADDDYDIQQYKILPENKLAGQTYGEAFTTLNKECRMVLLGMATAVESASQRKVSVIPDDDTIINVGDFLIGVLGGGTLKDTQKFFGINDGCF